jgi:glycosyltransferase involved in cell wall biosynthesis
MKFSLVIPCYNEAANLPLLFNRCKELAKRSDIEIILIDNGSTDNSHEVLLNLVHLHSNFRIVRVEQNRGYGFGILTGLRAAKGAILGWTHADMQTDPQDALQGLELFEKHGLEIFVKGKRYGRPLSDTFFTFGMSIFETLLLRKPLWDINAQPTLFSRAFFETWLEPPHDFSLDLYAYYISQHYGLEIYRFPVRFGERAHGISHWNTNWTAKQKFIRRTVDFSLQLRKNIKL